MIPGVEWVDRTYHEDERGWLCEAWRHDHKLEMPGRLVLMMESYPNSLRGSHVHKDHSDWFFLPKGLAIVGLKDARRSSPVFGKSEIVTMSGGRGSWALVVPPGVVHGVYFPEHSYLLTVESEVYDPSEEVKVDWTDSELGIPWPFDQPLFPHRTPDGLSWKALLERIEPWQAGFKLPS